MQASATNHEKNSWWINRGITWSLVVVRGMTNVLRFGGSVGPPEFCRGACPIASAERYEDASRSEKVPLEAAFGRPSHAGSIRLGVVKKSNAMRPKGGDSRSTRYFRNRPKNSRFAAFFPVRRGGGTGAAGMGEQAIRMRT
jgi:hypothetical protein